MAVKRMRLRRLFLSTCVLNHKRGVRIDVIIDKGRTIRKLMGGGGGAGEVQKKNSRKGKLNEKKFLQAN